MWSNPVLRASELLRCYNLCLQHKETSLWKPISELCRACIWTLPPAQIYISLLTSKYQAAVRRVETHWRRQWAASPRSTDRSVGVYLTSNLPDASVLQIPPSWLKALPSWEDCPLSMHFLCVRQSRIGARNKGTAARQGLVP